MEPDVPPPPLTCPRCGLVDQVQKVSAVVTAGVSTGSGSGAGYMVGSFGSSGSSATAFGRMYQERVDVADSVAHRCYGPMRVRQFWPHRRCERHPGSVFATACFRYLLGRGGTVAKDG